MSARLVSLSTKLAEPNAKHCYEVADVAAAGNLLLKGHINVKWSLCTNPQNDY